MYELSRLNLKIIKVKFQKKKNNNKGQIDNDPKMQGSAKWYFSQKFSNDHQSF